MMTRNRDRVCNYCVYSLYNINCVAAAVDASNRDNNNGADDMFQLTDFFFYISFLLIYTYKINCIIKRMEDLCVANASSNNKWISIHAMRQV